MEEGAPVLTSNFPLESDLPRLLSLAWHVYNNSRPRMSAALLESCMTAMGLLPIQQASSAAPSASALQAYDLLAASYHGSDLTAEAGSIYEYLVKLDEEAAGEAASEAEGEGTPANAQLLTNYAVNSLDQGDYRKSRELFDAALEATRALEHDPNLILMSQIFMERSNLAAEDPMEASGDALDYIQRAVFILTTLEKKLPKGDKDSTEARQIRTSLAEAFRNMGKIQLSRRQNNQAIRSLRQSLKLAPHNVETISTMSHAEDMPSYSESLPPITVPTKFVEDGAPIEFVTFASDPSKCELSRLLDSGRRFGVSFNVLGQGYPTAQWKNGLKLELLLEFLEGLPEDKLVVVVDGYDVVLSGGREDFIDRYNTILTLNPSKRAVINADDPKPVIFQAVFTF
jgi:tetratricopeptide (TPR) repeat protein